ncbi:MAG: hypothetical protein JXK05_03685 [Campylobacterales bacterium]|nr:hypothetical protein [Campylobacterales bacterium]
MIKYTLLISALWLLSACAPKSLVDVPNFKEGVQRISTNLLYGVDQPLHERIVVLTSLVGIDDLEHSSSFGRLFSESLMTDFKLKGWRVIEYRGTDIVTLSKEGEFLLNRGRLKEVPQNALVLVGTYGRYKEALLVNTRLIDLNANELLSAASVSINDPETLRMALFDINDSGVYRVDVKPDDCKSAHHCWSVLP